MRISVCTHTMETAGTPVGEDSCINMLNIKWWLCQVVPHPDHGQIGMRQRMVMVRTAQTSNAMHVIKEGLYSKFRELTKTLPK